MSRPRITIVGTGLIGTSVGLGLAARTDRNYEIVGVDREQRHLRDAKKAGAIDRIAGSLEEAFDSAGLVIIATIGVISTALLAALYRRLVRWV